MPDIDDVSYSREETIACIRDYYKFLTKMYLDDSDIEDPPDGGWPGINSSPDGFNKNEEVMALLRHLPYISAKREIDGAANTSFAEWHKMLPECKDGENLRLCTQGSALWEKAVPKHCISLTDGDRNRPDFILDTNLGIIYWVDAYVNSMQDHTREKVWDDPESYAPEEEWEWREEHSAWAVADFFELLKDQFLKLNWVPLSARRVNDIWTVFQSDSDGMIDAVQAIYRDHGWPDLNRYRKDACIKAIHEMLLERYPRAHH